MSKPVAVIIGDIHFTLATLQVASESLCQALDAATDLGIPLVINGDTLDTKAIMRGELINELISILQGKHVPVYINVGNHEMINAKGTSHTLNFLRPYATVIDTPMYVKELDSWVIPYIDNPDTFKAALAEVPAGSRLIIHQGLAGADMGHYVADHAALTPNDFKDYRTISSHYHRRQDIPCGDNTFSYIGNPYTLSYSEAPDPAKGFQVLWADGRLEFTPTALRTHVIHETTVDNITLPVVNSNDLVWLKISGPSDKLAKLNKKQFPANYKIDLISTDAIKDTAPQTALTKEQALDHLIDASNAEDTRKQRLKDLWRSLV